MQRRSSQKTEENPKISVNEQLANMCRLIRKSGTAEEAQEAAELEQLLQNRIRHLTAAVTDKAA